MQPSPTAGRTSRRLIVALSVCGLVVAALLAPTLADTTVAGGSDLRAARSKYPDIVGTNIDKCSLCHVSESNYRRDPYGRDYEDARGDFEQIEGIDSDGDGFTNIEEINALTFPGKADSVPTVTATAPVTVTATLTPTMTATLTPVPSPSDTPTQATQGPTPTATSTSGPSTYHAFLPWLERP